LIDFYDIDNRRELPLDNVRQLTEGEFLSLFSKSPVKRTKLKGLKRNAEFLNESI
jgi:epoxyqueuosine reductase QueG